MPSVFRFLDTTAGSDMTACIPDMLPFRTLRLSRRPA
jgi:hypothetical protein